MRTGSDRSMAISLPTTRRRCEIGRQRQQSLLKCICSQRNLPAILGIFFFRCQGKNLFPVILGTFTLKIRLHILFPLMQRGIFFDFLNSDYSRAMVLKQKPHVFTGVYFCLRLAPVRTLLNFLIFSSPIFTFLTVLVGVVRLDSRSLFRQGLQIRNRRGHCRRGYGFFAEGWSLLRGPNNEIQVRQHNRQRQRLTKDMQHT